MSRLVSSTLRIGEPAPSFELPSWEGGLCSLGETLQSGPVLLVFLPGVWAPETRKQLEELAAANQQFAEAGVQLLTIASQRAAGLEARLAGKAYPFPLLADELREVVRDYGTYRAICWDGLAVTRPAAFLLDADGIVRFIYVGAHNGDVPETQALLALAQSLIRAAPPAAVSEEELLPLGAASDEPPAEGAPPLLPDEKTLVLAEGLTSDDGFHPVGLPQAEGSTDIDGHAREETLAESQQADATTLIESVDAEPTPSAEGARPDPYAGNGPLPAAPAQVPASSTQLAETSALPVDGKR